MRTIRLLLDDPVVGPGLLELPPDRSRYVARVLRARAGAPVVVADGQGGELPGTVEEIRGNRVTVRLKSRHDSNCESPLAVTLALAITKGERMDVAVQKAVELGVARIVPLFTERCVVRLDADRAGKRRQHWQEVARSAAEQSGRDRAPPVGSPMPVSEWLTARIDGAPPGLVLDPNAATALNEVSATGMHALDLLIGPEGGLTSEEVGEAVTAGFTAVRLGPRVLRAETAAVATLTAVQLLFGDLGR